MQDKLRVLFVCTANICRSPTAEAMFCSKAITANIMDKLIIDSAGTHDYKVGEPPDSRAQDAASKRGYDLSALRARKLVLHDFDLFDYIIAMDMKNMVVLESLIEGRLARKPELMMSFSQLYKNKDVPDPYGGGDRDFELVLDMLESATDGLLTVVKQNLMRREKIR